MLPRFVDGLRCLTSGSLAVTVSAAAGGKITSLVSTASSREWLWTDPVRQLSSRPATGDFASHELSGWDECFPTIGPCEYPVGANQTVGDRTSLSDHGELWRRAWDDVSAGDHEIALQIDGQELPYRFARKIRIDGVGLRLDYRVGNLGAAELRCLWSMHPLFRAQPGMRLLIAGTPAITKEFGFGGRIGPHDGADGSGGRWDEYRWPIVRGQLGQTDLSRLEVSDPPVTDKVVARGMADGWIALVDPTGSECLALSWDAAVVPYCGICLNMGAWPFDDHPQSWVALEPTTGGTDRLDEAYRRGEAMTIPPRGQVRWSVHLEARPLTDQNPLKAQQYQRMERTP